VAGRLLIEGTVADEQEKRKAKIIVDALYDLLSAGRGRHFLAIS